MWNKTSQVNAPDVVSEDEWPSTIVYFIKVINIKVSLSSPPSHKDTRRNENKVQLGRLGTRKLKTPRMYIQKIAPARS